MAKKTQERPTWYRLDNAAKIYPAVRNARWSANFRVTVILKDRVDPVILQQALDVTIQRFLNFRLKLHKGLFWYYLEEGKGPYVVEPDVANPCMRFGKDRSGGQLFRVRYYERRIAVEVFHVLSDGGGGMMFLKTLTAEYLKRKEGIEIPCEYGVLDCTEEPDPEEMEDAFKRYARFKTLKSRKESKAYHFEGTPEPPDFISIITGQCPADQVLQMARERHVTLTEFIVAVVILALSECQKRSNRRVERPVKVSVPINLRKYYPSKTMRNFSSFVNPGIEPRYGEFSFEEILEEVHHFMCMNVKEKYLNAIMCKNLSSEMNPALRAVPLFLKNIALNVAFRKYGDNVISATLSNLGNVKLPGAMVPYVERFDLMLGRCITSMPNVTVVTYQNILNIAWTSGIREKDVEREFFTALVKMGIPVKIESNLS